MQADKFHAGVAISADINDFDSRMNRRVKIGTFENRFEFLSNFLSSACSVLN